jgi:hypothetical protein
MVGVRLNRAVRLFAAASAMVLVAGVSTGSSASEPPPPRLPRSVTLDGVLTLDRRAHDACFVAVPPVLTAQVSLTIDTDAGTVSGTISEGSGTGEYLVDGSCEGDDTDTMWQATTTFTGSFQGTVDSTTGTFTAPVQLVVEHSGEHGWFPGMPEYDDYLAYGGGFVCGPTVTPSCPNPETVADQTATLTGQLQPDGTVTAGFDWYTGTCVAVSAESSSYTSEGCPTAGTLDLQVTNVVQPANNPPEIAGIAVDPPEPTGDDTVIVTVSASDPDGDPLTYEWQIDGTAMSAGTAQVSWAGLPSPRPS